MDNPGCSCSFCQPKIEAGILAKSNLAFVFDNWPFHRRSVLDPSRPSSLSQIARHLQTRFPHASFIPLFKLPVFRYFIFLTLSGLCAGVWRLNGLPRYKTGWRGGKHNTKGDGSHFGQFQEKLWTARLVPAWCKFVRALRSVYISHSCHHRPACKVTLPVSRLKGLFKCMRWSGKSSDSER